MTFLESHLFPLSHSFACSSASPSPFFPLSHPLMVIYLAGKGFAFSPETSTSGHERKQGSLLLEGGMERRERWKPTRNISSVSVSLVTPNVSSTLLYSRNRSEGLATNRKNYMSIFVPIGCLALKKRYISWC